MSLIDTIVRDNSDTTYALVEATAIETHESSIVIGTARAASNTGTVKGIPGNECTTNFMLMATLLRTRSIIALDSSKEAAHFSSAQLSWTD